MIDVEESLYASLRKRPSYVTVNHRCNTNLPQNTHTEKIIAQRVCLMHNIISTTLFFFTTPKPYKNTKCRLKNICADTQGFIILLWLSKHDE